MMNKLIRIILIVTLFAAPFAGKAQSELGLHFMNEIQQVTQTNPAIFPEQKVNINFMIPLPPLSIGFANSGFTWNQVLQPTNDADTALFLDFQNLKNKKGNRVSSHMTMDIFQVNFRVKQQHMFTLGATEKLTLHARYPNEFLDFFANGNTGFIGETFNPDHDFRIMHWREYALGYAYAIDSTYTVGIKLKYLAGLGTVLTERSNISFYTGTAEEAYKMDVEIDYLINQAGFDQNSAQFDEGEYMTNHKNSGFGIDIGGTWQFNDKINLKASVLDLGSITWDTYTRNYAANGNLVFEGVDVNDFIIKGLNLSNDTLKLSLDDYLDSLGNDLGFEETRETFKTPLVTRTYLSGTYKLDEKSTASVLLFGEFYKGLNAGVTLGYYRRMGKAFSFGGYYSYKNRDFFNFGLSTVLTVPRFQVYLLTDNVLGLALPRYTKNFHLRFGANWTFGDTYSKDRKVKKANKPPKVKKEKKSKGE
jgi:hypothetical protein